MLLIIEIQKLFIHQSEFITQPLLLFVLFFITDQIRISPFNPSLLFLIDRLTNFIVQGHKYILGEYNYLWLGFKKRKVLGFGDLDGGEPLGIGNTFK